LTVDNLVKQMNLPRVDILKIDTEGWDPAVLLGAFSTLSSVRYLEFEVHRDLKKTPWHSTKLKLVIDKLHDEKEFECYWLVRMAAYSASIDAGERPSRRDSGEMQLVSSALTSGQVFCIVSPSERLEHK